MDKLFTIGVYEFDKSSFFAALRQAKVDALVDVRQRRSVRGAKYAFANATRLDHALHEEGIKSIVCKVLAPSNELRRLQRDVDHLSQMRKSDRNTLSSAFIEGYEREVLNKIDPNLIVTCLSEFRRPALLCVEKQASACHRGIAARWIGDIFNCKLEHIEP